jgi:hypothetical protein
MITFSMVTDKGSHTLRHLTLRDMMNHIEEVMRNARITKVSGKFIAPPSELTEVDLAKADAYLRGVANDIIFERHFVDGVLDIYQLANYPRRTA